MVQTTYRPPIEVLGPEHAGLRMTADEFSRLPGGEGYKFELINGVVEASPAPQPYAQDLAFAIAKHLAAYRLPEQLQKRLAIRIDQLELSVRATNVLDAAKITTVGELIGCDEDYLLALRSFGKTSLVEVQKKLSELRLSLNMNPDGGFANVMLDPRVFVSVDEKKAMCPQPDVAAYARYPRKPVMTYEGVEPVLAVEVVTPDSRDKDYRRNRDLYVQVAAIREYWIVDPTKDALRPSMTVNRRDRGKRCKVGIDTLTAQAASEPEPFERLDISAGGVYEPARWPGLRIDLERLASE